MFEITNAHHDWHVHNRKIIAYVRACDEMDLDEQFQEIERYASEHRLKIEDTFCDVGPPMFGLRHAIEALEHADTLIVCNLNRLVMHREDRLRDLRPILHRFCSNGGKHLISIEEGVNTASPTGQLNVLELINGVKDNV